MSEINSKTQVKIEELEKAVTLLCKNYHGNEEIADLLFNNFPDFTFTKIGTDWKVTQDLRMKDNYSHCVTIKVSMTERERESVEHILNANGIWYNLKDAE